MILALMWIRLLSSLKHKQLRQLLIILSIAFTTQTQAQIAFQPQVRGDTQGPAALFGVWGTSAQCASYKSGDNQDIRLFPYVITNDWIQQGMFYCYILWQDQYSNDQGIQAHAYAYAQCGEDGLRDYRIMLNLHRSILKIHWSEDFTTRELEACQ